MTESKTVNVKLEEYVQPEGYVPNERLYIDLENILKAGHKVLLFDMKNKFILSGHPHTTNRVHNWQTPKGIWCSTARKAMEWYAKTDPGFCNIGVNLKG